MVSFYELMYVLILMVIHSFSTSIVVVVIVVSGYCNEVRLEHIITHALVDHKLNCLSFI